MGNVVRAGFAVLALGVSALAFAGCASESLEGSHGAGFNGMSAKQTMDDLVNLVDGTAALVDAQPSVLTKAAVPCSGDLPDGVQFTYGVSFPSTSEGQSAFDDIVASWRESGIDVTVDNTAASQRAFLDNQPWVPIDGPVSVIAIDQMGEFGADGATFQIGAWSTCAAGDPSDFSDFVL